MAREPRASVALICENEDKARELFQQMHSSMEGLRLALDDQFEFRPGIDVTSVDLVKGLEFDYVLLPDANNSSYHETDFSRRRLHVALTRAVHQLWILGAPGLSSLLKGDA